MIIGLVSDIHDHLSNLDKALKKLADTDVLLCCGDLCSPFVMHALGKGYHRPIHIVFGNNDGDHFRLTQASMLYPHMTLHGEIFLETFDGCNLAMTHFDTVASALATSTSYDFVLYGHNHQHEIRKLGNLTLVNPGEVYGGLSGSATCAQIETQSKTVSLIQL